MAFLVLKGREKSYSFRYDDLQHFPDSLLAGYSNLANKPCPSTATAAAEYKHGTELILSRTDDVAGPAVVMDLSTLPDSPLTNWPYAPAVAESIYRHRYITPEVLTAVLQGTESKLGRFAHEQFVNPHEKLVDLLSYLNLCGLMSQWLPPPETVALNHFNVLQFCCSSGVLDRDYQLKSRAREAVHLMLSYRPSARAATTANTSRKVFSWDAIGNNSRTAPFVLACGSQGQAVMPLRVYALDSTSWDELQRGHSHNCRLSQVLSGGNLLPPVSLSDANLGSDTLIGSPYSSSQISELVKTEFASITAATSLCLTECNVPAYERGARMLPYLGHKPCPVGPANISVWVINW